MAVDGGADDMTCAICLEQTPPMDLSTIKGCEHQHWCVGRVLKYIVLLASMPTAHAAR